MSDILTSEDVLQATLALDTLCREEYGYGIVELLADRNEDLAAYRLRRLTGVTLKMPFATAEPINGRPTATGALRAWTWKEGVSDGVILNMNDPAFPVLDELRRRLPELDPSYRSRSPSWPHLLDEADNESGLFQVLVRWVDDKLRGRPTQDFATYYSGETDSRLKTTADVAETVFNYYTAPVLASFIPVAGLVVPLVLIGLRFGLTAMLNANARVRVEPDSKN